MSIKRNLKRQCLVVAILLIGCTTNDHAKQSSVAQQHLDALCSALAGNGIGTVEILQIPARIETQTRVTPEMLEKQWRNKVIIRDVGATAYRGKLIEALRSVSVTPRKDFGDLRWAVVFYARDGKRAGVIYFNGSGNYGAIDDDAVSFQGSFFNWLDDTFSSCLQ